MGDSFHALSQLSLQLAQDLANQTRAVELTRSLLKGVEFGLGRTDSKHIRAYLFLLLKDPCATPQLWASTSEESDDSALQKEFQTALEHADITENAKPFAVSLASGETVLVCRYSTVYEPTYLLLRGASLEALNSAVCALLGGLTGFILSYVRSAEIEHTRNILRAHVMPKINIGVVTFNTDEAAAAYNEGARDLLGNAERSEMLGRLQCLGDSGMEDPVQYALDHRSFRGEATVQSIAGNRNVTVTVLPLANMRGQDMGSAMVLQDTSDPDRKIERLRIVLEGCQSAMIGMDYDRRITEWNDSARQVFGFERKEVVGKSIDQDEELSKLRFLLPHIESMSKCRSREAFSTVGMRKNGETFPCEGCISTVSFAEEQFLILSVTDVSERVAAEERIHRQNSTLQGIFEGSPDGFAAIDGNGLLSLANPVFAKIFHLGEDLDAAVGKNWAKMCTPEMLEHTRTVQAQPLDRGARSPCVQFLQTCPSENKMYLITLGKILSSKDTQWGIFVMIRDVTEQKRSEAESEAEVRERTKQARDSEAFLRSVTDASPSSIYVKDLVGKYVLANTAFAQSANRSKADIINHYDYEVFPDYVEKIRPMDEEIIRTKVAFSAEFVSRAETFHLAKFPLFNEQGELYSIGCISTDITRLKEAERARVAQERRFRILMELSPIGMALHGPQGNTMKVNQAYLATWGVQLPTIAEMVKAAIESSAKSGMPPELDKAMRGESLKIAAKRYQANGGHERYLELYIYPIKDEDNQLTEIISITVDVTDLKMAENDRVQSEARAEASKQASIARTQFLASVSHELRTPLNGIIGMADFLSEAHLTAEQTEFATSIYTSAKGLLHIINDILDFSKMDAGKMELSLAPFDLQQAIQGVVQTVQPMAHKKRLELDVFLHPDLPQAVIGDAPRLGQIILNLLGNAIKFSDSGTVTVRAVPAPSEYESVSNKDVIPSNGILHLAKQNGLTTSHSGPWMLLEVIDTGVGIPESAHQRIFQPFSQVDASISRKHGGTGLGLNICKLLVEQMGGHIGFRSVAKKGTTFFFTLPLEVCNEKLAKPTINPAKFVFPVDAFAGRKYRVLVAEDNPTNQKVITRYLQRLQLDVELVDNGKLAVEAVQSGRKIDICLMDIQMPVMDGLDATARIRALPSPYNSLPIIALTANAVQGDREMCLNAGMDDYVSKPIEPRHLVRVLQGWLTAGR
ncbi:uncharacterized protein EV422DRAFT_524092 [Fimicolochytrium jonesii]|uniref:uncharacterized protein n=1 Tax=Fimicolochytrium jonesii TaxID=1396493 RepID=UPI0022FEA2F6|nr:uncharacterized protein EV422DRAFT_524092 [Fimicolochytrium jonesii]KAI8822464.1 hypothetical protein EV422DRAFT_524092 [Fimicolochytrium jonesii]